MVPALSNVHQTQRSPRRKPQSERSSRPTPSDASAPPNPARSCAISGSRCALALPIAVAGVLEKLQIGEYEHASHADGGDGETGDDEPGSKPDEQQLAGQAEPPGGVIIQIETIGWPVAY